MNSIGESMETYRDSIQLYSFGTGVMVVYDKQASWMPFCKFFENDNLLFVDTFCVPLTRIMGYIGFIINDMIGWTLASPHFNFDLAP